MNGHPQQQLLALAWVTAGHRGDWVWSHMAPLRPGSCEPDSVSLKLWSGELEGGGKWGHVLDSELGGRRCV